MLLLKIINKIKTYIYKKELEIRTNCNLPTVKVLGTIRFENSPKIELGSNVTIWPNVTFSGNGTIKIGNNCKIGADSHFYAHPDGGINIGNDTIIAAQTYIIDNNHEFKKDSLIREQPLIASKINIGNDVWIGTNTTIIKGASIGNHSVIGAKALVNSRIPDNGIAVGIPAKVIKYR